MFKTLTIILVQDQSRRFIYCIIFLTRKRSTFSILECYNCRFVLFYQILQHDFEGDIKCMKQTIIGSYSSVLRLYRCYIFLMLQGVNVLFFFLLFFLCFTSDVNEVICTQKENVENKSSLSTKGESWFHSVARSHSADLLPNSCKMFPR